MTKEERHAQRLQNKVLADHFKKKMAQAHQEAHDRVLDETVTLHAQAIEKILSREMPKDWKLKVRMELIDDQDVIYETLEATSRKGAKNSLSTTVSFTLGELLDKSGIEYYIKNRIPQEYIEPSPTAVEVYPEVADIPFISTEQLLEWQSRYRQGDAEAEKQLRYYCKRFVAAVAKNYLNRGRTPAELLEAGVEGYLLAARQFDPNSGYHFIPTAIPIIRKSIQESIGTKN